jgi:Domain of Unknown Function with PDB structure (DUF3857)
MESSRWRAPLQRLLAIALIVASARPALADNWLPVSAEELAMTSEPKAPGASAIYLYRQVDRDDKEGLQSEYVRIKILTDEGRGYGNVTISFAKERESIGGIQARTIRPDGSIATFDGTVYEQPVYKARDVKVMAKSFTLPEVQKGCIIEYRFERRLGYGYVSDSRWTLNENLFTRYGRFSLEPNRQFSMRMSWPVGLPEGTQPPQQSGSRYRLEIHDVPAFVSEDLMPPEEELKMRVDFIYVNEAYLDKDPVVFWKNFGKHQFRQVEDFVDQRQAMTRAVAQIVAPEDSADVKLHKIYARVQQIRNQSFERRRTEQEVNRENAKEDRNVKDVWEHGYGDGEQIAWLFLGLVRAAGLTADPVLASKRNRYFFDRRLMNPTELNSRIVVVKLDGHDLFLDPGTPFNPFGQLPWPETAVSGLRLDRDGGTWVTTPVPAATDSSIARTADLTLTATGSLEGKITVTYTGLEALARRVRERNEDEVARRRFLEVQVRSSIANRSEVSLANTPDWDSADTKLVAVFDVKIPGWANIAGQRAFSAIGLFGAHEKRAFLHGFRVHPVYFAYPFEMADDITIALPAGWEVNSVPQALRSDIKVMSYETAAEQGAGKLHLQRKLVANMVLLDQKYYGSLQDFFDKARTGDDAQVIFAVAKNAGGP